MATSKEIRIYAKNKEYSFYYSYNKNSTFLDLLEHFSYLFPELGICQCFGFQTKNNTYNSNYYNHFNKYNRINIPIQIENDYLITKYSENLYNLELTDKNKKRICSHYYNNYLKYSKTKIIFLLEKEISNLKSNNNAQTEKIINLNKEKNEKEMKINDLSKEKKEQEREINFLNREKNEKEIKINNLNREKNEQEKKINNLNREKNEQEKKINNLNKEKNEQVKEINNLNKEKNEQEKKINNLNKEKKEKEMEINNLNKEKKEKEMEINNLNKEKKEKEMEINNLNTAKKEQEMKINNLNRDKNLLEYAINGDVDKINLLNQLGVEGENLKKKDNLIQIDNTSNEIKGNQTYIKEKFIDFYDVIIHIDSIKDINKGWRIEFNEKTKKNYESFKNQKIIKIGVIGNSNKGKSFLLSKISKIKLPSGTSIRTEGLSIKYPELEKFKDRKIALLDSAGLETPVLNLGNQNNVADDKVNELFREKSREKLITELFLQNYIINNSDVLIAVVGILTYSEQKLLMKIKKEIERSKINTPLFIIHNLITYTSVQQVQDYINEFLLKSATFSLEEGHKVSTQIKTTAGIYYYESNKDQKIFHLIFANEGSEAGKYYNQYTLDFLEKNYQNVTHLKCFDVIETIKDRYLILSKDIIEKNDEKDSNLSSEEKNGKANDNYTNNSHEDKTDKKIEEISFDDSNPELIKLKDEKEIILKKCLTDELGFSNLKANGFEPTYNLFKQENKIIVRVEAPGNCKLESKIEYAGEYNIIKLKGEKKKDKEHQNEKDNIFNTREYGNFSLEIPLKTEDYLLSNEEPSINNKKGILFIEYTLLQKVKVKGYTTTEDEEI